MGGPNFQTQHHPHPQVPARAQNGTGLRKNHIEDTIDYRAHLKEDLHIYVCVPAFNKGWRPPQSGSKRPSFS